MFSGVSYPFSTMLARKACCNKVPILYGLRDNLLSSTAGAVLLAAGVISAVPAIAADTHWTNAGGDNDWNNPANWTNGLPSNNSGSTTYVEGTTPAVVDGIAVI